MRAAFALAFAPTPLGRYLFLDALVYDELASALRAGSGAALQPFFVEPLYAWFLAAVYGLFGHAPGAVRALQALGGAAAAVLVFDCARRLYGQGAGWAAGLAAALYGPFVFYDAMLLKTSAEVLFAALFFWLLVRAAGPRPACRRALARDGLETQSASPGEARRPLHFSVWLAVGLVLGLAAILKANFLVLLPVAVGAPFLGLRVAAAGTGPAAPSPPRRAARGALWVLAGVAAATLPVVARNSALAGELTFLTTGAGMNFYQGNRPDTDGGLDIPPFIQLDPLREQADSVIEARRRSGRPGMAPNEASGFWLGEALRFIRAEPAAWLRLLGRKLLLFWNHYEAADNLSFHYTRSVVPWLWLAPLGFWLAAPLGLAGVVAGAGGGRPETLLRASVLLLVAGTVLFHVADRYRLAAVPALIVLGTGFVQRLARSWRRGRRRRAAALAALAAAAALLVNVPDFYPGGQDAAPFDRIMALGYAADGDAPAAKRYAERAAGKFYRRGMVHLERGEFYRAEIYFASTLDVAPGWPGAWYHLGASRERLGKSAEAAQAYERAVAADSFAVEALTQLGRLHMTAERLDEAERALLAAEDRAPQNVHVLAALGDLRATEGRLEEALELFTRARSQATDADWLDRRIAAARASLAGEAAGTGPAATSLEK